MSRHPLGGALRVSEEPPRAAFLAGVERLWSGLFASQNENVGLMRAREPGGVEFRAEGAARPRVSLGLTMPLSMLLGADELME